MSAVSPCRPTAGWRRARACARGQRCGPGIVSDLAETPDSVFVNARPAVDWETPGTTRLRPTVARVHPDRPALVPRHLSLDVGQALAADYGCFVHFVQPSLARTAGITSASSRTTPCRYRPRSGSRARRSRTAPGTSPFPPTSLRATTHGRSAWTRRGGGRLTLQGQSDAHSRIVLGTLHVAASGLTFTPTPPEAGGTTAPVNHDNRVLDFGTVRTNGSVFVRREGRDWALRPFPSDRPFTVLLSAARFGHPNSARVLTAGGGFRLTDQRPTTGPRWQRTG